MLDEGSRMFEDGNGESGVITAWPKTIPLTGGPIIEVDVSVTEMNNESDRFFRNV